MISINMIVRKIPLLILLSLTGVSAKNNKRADMNTLFDKAFAYGKNVLKLDKQLKNELKQNDLNEFSVEGAEGLFNLETEYATAVDERAIVFINALRYLLANNISLSDFEKRGDLIQLWKTKAKKNSLCEEGVLSCNPNRKYRTADGSCNNLKHPEWGKSETPQLRFVPAAYDVWNQADYGALENAEEWTNGIDSPRQRSVTGDKLPSPRKVSNILLNCVSEIHSAKLSAMVMAWGQFLDHDMVATPQSQGANGSSIQCCGIKTAIMECFPISVPSNDPHFEVDCLNFVRSAGAVDTNICNFPSRRQQLNQITSFIDASNVYGSSEEHMNRLRTFFDGKLKTSANNLLPRGGNHTCRLTREDEFCMLAGDGRANEVPNLSFMHLLFMREHNRIAHKFKTLNSHWDDEKLFQETRKVISALVQQITYTDFLPVVLDKATMDKHALFSGTKSFPYVYDDSVNPSIRNGFASAAYRFGHSLIPSLQAYFTSKNNILETFAIEDTFFNPHTIQYNDGRHVTDLGRWLSYNTSMKLDRCFEAGVRDNLFLDKENKSLDLPALNIQRGRDHGIPSYTVWRKWCGLSSVNSFNITDGGLIDHDKKAALLLSEAYRDVRDIDLFAGGMSEKHVPGGNLGPTFSCILGRQFYNLKYGDRYWYETKDTNVGFTNGQLDAIKKVKLSKIVCESVDITYIQDNIFNLPNESSNKLKQCADLPDLDVSQWAEKSVK